MRDTVLRAGLSAGSNGKDGYVAVCLYCGDGEWCLMAVTLEVTTPRTQTLFARLAATMEALYMH